MNGAINGNGENVTIDSNTYYVHLGLLRGFYNDDDDLDTGQSMDTLICVGSKPLKITLALEAFGGQVLAYIYEGTEVSDCGIQLRTSRFNRIVNSPIESKVFSSPSITNVGDLFVKRRVLAHAQGNSGITTAINAGVERILKPYTKYLLRQTALADNISITLVGTILEYKRSKN